MSDRVRFKLEAQMAIKQGFNQIATIAETTLGPMGGVVALERIAQRNESPELLNDVATIARRIVEIPDPFENMGAMLARHLAWRVREEVGDGSATAMIIAKAVIEQSIRYIAAGHNAMSLWKGLKKSQTALEEYLKQMAEPLEDTERIAALAASVVRDKELGRFIEEIFDIVGPQGFVEVRGAYGMESDREYVEGVYWNSGWVSPYFADKKLSTQATIKKPYLLITDQFLESAQDMIPVLEAVRRAGGKSLVVIAGDVKDSALNLMVTNNARGKMRLLAIKAPRYGDMRLGVLEDMAIATGGRFIRKDAGESIAKMTLDDLGRAQQVVCGRSTFTVMGTMGNPQAIREQIRTLQSARAGSQEKEERKNLDERVGKLLGGTAILHVSGQNKADRDRRKELAESAVQMVRSGLQGGIVPGGGSAYVAALSALDQVELTEDERHAKGILQEALLAPMTCLAKNAGYAPGPVIAHVKDAPPGWGFDVVQGKVVDMMQNNIVDPLPTVLAGLTYGLSVATMAMTTDALIYRSYRDKSPSLEP